MRRRLNLDNAATSFPKPRAVHQAMAEYAAEIGSSPGRGSYAESIKGAEIIRRCRLRLAELFNAESPDHIVFGLNTSDALNLAIHGLVRHRAARLLERGQPGPIHVITTAMEHNSILRPLNDLAADPVLAAAGTPVDWTCLPVDQRTGLLDPESIRGAVRPETLLVAVVHASNVTGTLQPIRAIGAVCRDVGLPLLADAAQSAGRLPIDVQADMVDLLAFPGHKSLLGPLGTGGLVIRPGLETQIAPTRQGGTGTVSERDVHPDTMPDRYEAGSHNTLGIAGLLAGVEHLLQQGLEPLWRREQDLIRQILTAIAGQPEAYPGLSIIGPTTTADRVGVFSFTHHALPPQELAAILETEFGILTRAGIHCAPRAHETFGTTPRGGALRLSLGPFVTPQDVSYALDALSKVCTELSAPAA